MTLDLTRDYRATVYTSCGDFKIDLLEHRAPIAVNNFIFLSKEGFYDGLTWHEIGQNFIIQTGDPNGANGVSPDGPGYAIKDELPGSNDSYTYGVVGMANTGARDTSGSQFFVVVYDYAGAVGGTPSMLEIDPRYTVFGRVLPRFYGSIENIARQPAVMPTEGATRLARPSPPIFVERIEIEEG